MGFQPSISPMDVFFDVPTVMLEDTAKPPGREKSISISISQGFWRKSFREKE
jgi:hypothetical protein